MSRNLILVRKAEANADGEAIINIQQLVVKFSEIHFAVHLMDPKIMAFMMVQKAEQPKHDSRPA